MGGFGELEYKPQRSPTRSLSMSLDQASSIFFPYSFQNTLSNILPMLESCEISCKTWISRFSIKVKSSLSTLKLYFSQGNIQAKQSRAEPTVPSRCALALLTTPCGHSPGQPHSLILPVWKNKDKLTYSENEFGIYNLYIAKVIKKLFVFFKNLSVNI